MPVYGTCAAYPCLASLILDGRDDQRSSVLDMVVRRNAFGRQADSYEEDPTLRVSIWVPTLSSSAPVG